MATTTCSFSFNLFKGFRKCVTTAPAPPAPPALSGIATAVCTLSILVVLGATRISSKRLGDVVNTVVLVNTVLFMACVIAHGAGVVDFGFSSSFTREGFCVANKECPLMQSHMLCLYVDTVCAAVLYGLVRIYKDRPGMTPVIKAPIGILGHGIAHFAIWQQTRNMDANEPPPNGPADLFTAITASVLLSLFFFLLLRTVPSMPQSHAAVHSVIHGVILVTMVPLAFNFAYVNTVLMTLAVLYDMLKTKEKDRYYDLASLLINFPVTQLAWAEGFACEPYLMSIGGHVWYDAVIPMSFFAYLATIVSKQDSSKKVE